jgi:hypothetical protein
VLRSRWVVLLAGACWACVVVGEVFRCEEEDGAVMLRDTPCPIEPAPLRRRPMMAAQPGETERALGGAIGAREGETGARGAESQQEEE